MPRLNLKVAPLGPRIVRDNSNQVRSVNTSDEGIIIGWGRSDVDVLWHIQKWEGGYYEIIEKGVPEIDIRYVLGSDG